MKPILFEKDATNFGTLGIARLPDAVSCTVTEERNGEFELEMVYPVSGQHFSEIQLDRIIVAVAQDGGSKQAFRIYRIEATIDGRATILARHISYQLNFIPVDATSGSGTAADMFDALKTAALKACPFTFETDIATTASFSIETPTPMRSALGGVKGSMLDHYRGEFEWDNWTVKLLSSRGQDNGVRITYGKNLRDLTSTTDIGETITGVAAFYTGTDQNQDPVTVYSNPRVVENAHATDYAYSRVVPLDVSSEFETVPSEGEVTALAQAYINGTELARVTEALEIDFVFLWQSPEYIQYAPLERVKLCDTVYIGYPQLGVSVKKKVTKTVYNVLLDRYDSVELDGEATLSDTISEIESSTSENEDTTSKLKASVDSLLEKTKPMNFAIYETGTFTISAKTAITATDVPITFTKTYSAAPRLLVVGNNTAAAVYGLPSLTANSTTGATVRMRNTANHGNEASFRWFAIVTL